MRTRLGEPDDTLDYSSKDEKNKLLMATRDAILVLLDRTYSLCLSKYCDNNEKYNPSSIRI
jgi:hypothetical protein